MYNSTVHNFHRDHFVILRMYRKPHILYECLQHNTLYISIYVTCLYITASHNNNMYSTVLFTPITLMSLIQGHVVCRHLPSGASTLVGITKIRNTGVQPHNTA